VTSILRTVDCLLVCGIPAARLGLQIALEREGHTVRVAERWPGVAGSVRLVITDIPAEDDVLAYLQRVRLEAPRCHLLVWAPILPGYADATALYDRWVLPTATLDEVCRAVRTAGSSGRRYLVSAHPTVASPFSDEGMGGFTRRELELIRQFHPQVVLSRQELALRMNVKVTTVRFHVRNILEKTGLASLRTLQRHSEAELIAMGERRFGT